MQTCRFISSVNSTFMGSFLLSPDDDIEEEALCFFEVANLLHEQGHTQVSLFNSLADSHTAILCSRY